MDTPNEDASGQAQPITESRNPFILKAQEDRKPKRHWDPQFESRRAAAIASKKSTAPEGAELFLRSSYRVAVVFGFIGCAVFIAKYFRPEIWPLGWKIAAGLFAFIELGVVCDAFVWSIPEPKGRQEYEGQRVIALILIRALPLIALLSLCLYCAAPYFPFVWEIGGAILALLVLISVARAFYFGGKVNAIASWVPHLSCPMCNGQIGNQGLEGRRGTVEVECKSCQRQIGFASNGKCLGHKGPYDNCFQPIGFRNSLEFINDRPCPNCQKTAIDPHGFKDADGLSAHFQCTACGSKLKAKLSGDDRLAIMGG